MPEDEVTGGVTLVGVQHEGLVLRNVENTWIGEKHLKLKVIKSVVPIFAEKQVYVILRCIQGPFALSIFRVTCFFSN